MAIPPGGNEQVRGAKTADLCRRSLARGYLSRATLLRGRGTRRLARSPSRRLWGRRLPAGLSRWDLRPRARLRGSKKGASPLLLLGPHLGEPRVGPAPGISNRTMAAARPRERPREEPAAIRRGRGSPAGPPTCPNVGTSLSPDGRMASGVHKRAVSCQLGSKNGAGRPHHVRAGAPLGNSLPREAGRSD